MCVCVCVCANKRSKWCFLLPIFSGTLLSSVWMDACSGTSMCMCVCVCLMIIFCFWCFVWLLWRAGEVPNLFTLMKLFLSLIFDIVGGWVGGRCRAFDVEERQRLCVVEGDRGEPCNQSMDVLLPGLLKLSPVGVDQNLIKTYCNVLRIQSGNSSHAFMNKNCKRRQVPHLYEDTWKPLNEFEMRVQSTQRGLTLDVGYPNVASHVACKRCLYASYG